MNSMRNIRAGKQVLVVHSDFDAGGGAEAYASAVITELRRSGFSVTITDANGVVFPDGSRKKYLLGSCVMGSQRLRRLSLLKYAVACFPLRKMQYQYDLICSTYGEIPKLDVPAIRIMHAPAIFSSNKELLSFLGVENSRVVYTKFRQIYAFLLRKLAGIQLVVPSNQPVATIVNSKWTESILQRFFSLEECSVVYPKIRPIYDGRESAEKDTLDFVSIGRIVPNKRYEEAVKIVERLNRKRKKVHLTIVGRGSGKYYDSFLEWVSMYDFVTVLPNASEEDLRVVLSRSAFGLHCYKNEHFGISVAEMCLAGVVPFVFDGGGVSEIVTPRELRFVNLEDAVIKIERLLEDRKLLKRLRTTITNNVVLERAMAFDDEFILAMINCLKKIGVANSIELKSKDIY